MEHLGLGIRVGVVDLEVARVDLVHAEARVEISQGRDAGADPGDGLGKLGGLGGAVVGVEDGIFILRMS